MISIKVTIINFVSPWLVNGLPLVRSLVLLLAGFILFVQLVLLDLFICMLRVKYL